MNNLRVRTHNKAKTYNNILYVMFKAFRINDNHSLEYAKELQKKYDANLSIWILHPKEENERNNSFFLDGIKNYRDVLSLFTTNVYYSDNILDIISNQDIIVMDQAYLLEDKTIQNEMIRQSKNLGIGFVTTETNVIVPVQVTSDKEEYSARTIRPKIWKKLDSFIDIDTSYEEMFHYEKEALSVLETFAQEKLEQYEERNDPSRQVTSTLSTYLKYGFISPVTIYNYITRFQHPALESFLEELIIRRELSYNFVFYNEKYHQFENMTYGWAYQTMEVHAFDDKEYLYSIDDYINFRTHDPYFNAAMKQMVKTGYMHNYMRMYWGKKIIEWSKTFLEAYHIMIKLNNYYFIDGNTPNGYTGVAWCFGKHDRAWNEREIFGKIRYMNENGLKRKFDIETYVNQMERV